MPPSGRALPGAAMLDTLRVAEELRAAGLTEAQAWAIASTQKQTGEGLATKDDIARLEVQMKMLFAAQIAIFALLGAVFVKVL